MRNDCELPAPDLLSRSFCTLGLVGFLTVTLPAEDKVTPLRLPTTEQVTVTASRYQEKSVRVPANVTVISEEDIAASTAVDIPGLLRTLVNVQVTDITGNHRHYSVDLRGFGETAGSNTLVLVDGRRVNLPASTAVDWLQIPLDRVKRIEVTRGGRGSVLYGDNAGAGVINIITREEGPTRLELEMSGGSYGSLRPSGQVSGSRGDVSYGASGSYFRSEGYRDNSDIQGGDLGGSLGFKLGDLGRLDVSGGFHTDDVGLPGAMRESQFQAGAARTGTLNPDDFADTDDTYVLIQPTLNFLSQSSLTLDFSARRRDSSFFSRFSGGTFEGMTQTDNLALSPRVVIRERIGSLANNLSMGFDWIKAAEDIANTSAFGGFQSTNSFQLEKVNQGFYVHDEFYPLESLALSAGYRYDRANFRFAPSTPDQTSYDQNVFTTGVNYGFNPDTYVYAGYSGSFRYPVLNEMFNFFTNTIDSGITPQTSNGLEAGLRHYFGGSFFGELNFFQIDADREIFYNPAGGAFGFGANENFEGRTRRRGMEFSSGISRGLATLRGNYSVVQTRVRDGQYTGRQVPGVAAHKLAAEFFLQITSRLTASINGTYVGSRYFHSDWSNRFGKHDGNFLLNSRISYRWDRFTLFADFNNIMNHEYSEYGVLGGFPVERAFYPSPTFNARVGIRLPIL